jgi:phosphopantothenoylcysteine synthetase/decarboxylase
MIEELAILVDDFPGPANQTRCFLHILNLVVKSIIQQFDLPTSNDDDENMGKKELLKLAGEIEHEEEITASDGGEGDAIDDDNNEGWVDERDEMTEEELHELEESIQPVRLLLTKV